VIDLVSAILYKRQKRNQPLYDIKISAGENRIKWHTFLTDKRLHKPDEQLSCTFGKEWPSSSLSASFYLPNLIHFEAEFPSRASLSFIRYSIATNLQMPLDQIALDDIPLKRISKAARKKLPENIYPSDMNKTLAKWGKKPLVVLSDIVKLTIVDTENPSNRWEIQKVPLISRVYDLRLECRETHKVPISKLRLIRDNEIIDDEIPLNKLGFYDEMEVPAVLLPIGISRLYFSDLEGNRRIFDIRDDQGVTFRDLASHFHDIPAEVGFRMLSKALSVTEPIRDFPCNPAAPITVLLIELKIHYDIYGATTSPSRSLSITAADTVSDLIAKIRPRLNPLLELSVYLDDTLVPYGKLLDLDPLLTKLFRIHTQFPSSGNRMHLYWARFGERKMNSPLSPLEATARQLRAELAPRIGGDPDTIYFQDKNYIFLPDDERVYCDIGYRIVRRTTVERVIVHLSPVPPDAFNQKLKREFLFDRTKTRTAGDLERSLAVVLSLPAHTPIILLHGRTPLDKKKPVPSNTDLHLEYPGPMSVFVDIFLNLRVKKSEYLVRKYRIKVNREQHVLDVKLYALGLPGIGIQNALPGILQLRFFGCDLVDDELFWKYGIPAGCALDGDIHRGGMISIEKEGISSSYEFSSTDTIGTLLTVLGRIVPEDHGLLDAFHQDTKIPPEDCVSAFAANVVQIRKTRRWAKFMTTTGSQPLPVPIQGTVAEAIAILAERTGFPASELQLWVDGEPLPTGNLLPDEVTIVHLTDVTFRFEGATLTFRVNPAEPLFLVCRLLAESIQLPVDAIVMKLDEKPVNLKTTVEELHHTEFDVERTAIADDFDIELFLLRGAIPKKKRLRLPAGSTAQQVEELARAEWQLGDVNLDVVVEDTLENTKERVEKDARVALIDLGPGKRLAVISTVEMVAVSEDEAASFATLGRSEIPDLKPGETIYSFTVNGQIYPLKFGANATVGQARAKLAQAIGVESPEKLNLMAGGKALKDTYLLNRLRLGDKALSVFVPDESEILVLSARGHRKRK
jgi:hypothetical protein